MHIHELLGFKKAFFCKMSFHLILLGPLDPVSCIDDIIQSEADYSPGILANWESSIPLWGNAILPPGMQCLYHFRVFIAQSKLTISIEIIPIHVPLLSIKSILSIFCGSFFCSSSDFWFQKLV